MSYQYGASERLPVTVIARLKERDHLAHENQQLKQRLEEHKVRLAARTRASEAQARRINDLESRLQALTVDLAHPERKAEAECGTHAGYVRHVRTGSPTCMACKKAHNLYQRNYRRERTARLQEAS